MLAAITASSALAAPPPTPAPGIDWNSRSSIPVVINVGNLLIGIVTTLALAFFGALLILGLFKWARNKDEGRNMAGVSLLAIVLIGGFGGFMGAFTSLGALLHF